VHRIERANRLLRNSRIIILVGFGLLAIATLALIIGLFRSREADMWVVHTFQVQQTAQALLISTRDAESAVRSYLLSGDGKDLDQFEPSLTDAGSQLKALAELTSDNAVQQNRVQILGTLIQSKGEADRLRSADSHDSGRRLGDLHADRRARPPRTHGRA
jgi:CHASE3 domain sensor protein